METLAATLIFPRGFFAQRSSRCFSFLSRSRLSSHSLISVLNFIKVSNPPLISLLLVWFAQVLTHFQTVTGLGGSVQTLQKCSAGFHLCTSLFVRLQNPLSLFLSSLISIVTIPKVDRLAYFSSPSFHSRSLSHCPLIFSNQKFKINIIA